MTTSPVRPSSSSRRPLRRPALALVALAAATSLTVGATAGAGSAAPKKPESAGTSATKAEPKPRPKKRRPVGTTAAPVPLACSSSPEAAALAARLGAWAGTIHTLHPHQGQVYFGYGDYGSNTGSASSPQGTSVSSVSPRTGGFTTHLTGFKTEEVNTFRTIEGALYTPNIDPSAGADGTSSFASDRDGGWAENDGTSGAVHLFDVAGANGDLLLAGAHDAGDVDSYRASVWLSTDDGRTWTESMSDTPANAADRTGYERYYWMGAIGDKVYTRASINATVALRPLRVFDTRTDGWSTVPDKTSSPVFGDNIYRADDVVSWRGRLWSGDYANLLSFDGTTTTVVATTAAMGSAQAPILSVGDDGVLYAYASDGQVYRVELPTTGAAQASLVRVARVAPSATAFTVAAGVVWVSAAAAQICSYALPAS